MRKVLFFLIFLLLPFINFSQKKPIGSVEKKADIEHYHFRYKNSLTLYLKAFSKDTSNARLKLKIADSYRLLNDPAHSEVWYSKVKSDSAVFKSEQKMHYAEALSSNGKYTEAKKWYLAYQAAAGKDSRSDKKIDGINNQALLFEDSTHYVIRHTTEVNSALHDFSSTSYQKGLVFVSERNVNPKKMKVSTTGAQLDFLDLYYTEESEDGLRAREAFLAISSNCLLGDIPR